MNLFFERLFEEVEDERYKIHPFENVISRERDPPKAIKTLYQVENETQSNKNQKVIKNKNDELEVKKNPKNKKLLFQQQPKNEPPACPSDKRNKWLNFDKGCHHQICE